MTIALALFRRLRNRVCRPDPSVSGRTAANLLCGLAASLSFGAYGCASLGIGASPSPSTCIAAECRHLAHEQGWSCWGANAITQPASPQPTPADVPKLRDAVEVRLGPDRGCARFVDGSVSCWGDGSPFERVPALGTSHRSRWARRTNA